MANRPRVLVIDDDPAFLGLMDELLNHETRYDVLVCNEGESALAMLRSSDPDVLVLDIHMQGSVQGDEILRAVREDDSLSDTPVIVCTVDNEFLRDRADSLRELNCDWLEKPFDLDMLLGKIDQAIGQSAYPRTGNTVAGEAGS